MTLNVFRKWLPQVHMTSPSITHPQVLPESTWSEKVLPDTKQSCFVCNLTYVCQEKWNFHFWNWFMVVLCPRRLRPCDLLLSCRLHMVFVSHTSRFLFFLFYWKQNFYSGVRTQDREGGKGERRGNTYFFKKNQFFFRFFLNPKPCTCESEYHRDDGEGSGLEETDRLSYTRRYISLVTDSVRGWGIFR
jgi:hypothetical protein